MECTRRRSINRGYMRLEVWNESIDLFGAIHSYLDSIERIDFRLKGQLLDSTRSIRANIAEGYCRRLLNEYLQFLGIALGSSGESMTRMIGPQKAGHTTHEQFEKFNKSHDMLENKLISLNESLQVKRISGSWQNEFKEPPDGYTV